MNQSLVLSLAASEPTAPSILDTIPYLVGMVMVLATLTTLWGVCVICAHIIRLFTPAAAPLPKTEEPATKPAIAPPPSTDDDQIQPEIVAVIAAAVATVTSENNRIISIKPHNSDWEKAGRQSVLSSHRIR